jgi:hypothetical protein
MYFFSPDPHLNFFALFVSNLNRIDYFSLIFSCTFEPSFAMDFPVHSKEFFYEHFSRNLFMEFARDLSSEIGKVIAVEVKKEGRTFDSLLNRYSNRLFSRNFNQLQYDSQRQQVFMTILERAGHSNRWFSDMAQLLGKVGKSFIFVSIACAIYHICESNDKFRTASQEGTAWTLGAMLAMAGGSAGTFCGPGAVVCVPLGVFIGGILGSLGADYLFHWRD